MDGISFELRGVALVRAGRPVLHDVDVDLADHGVTVIVGPSGSGKSTLLRLCNRLTVPTHGVVRYRGTDVTELDPQRLRREVGMVFQQPIALPGSVADNLREGAAEATDAEIEAILVDVGLPGAGDRDATALSGGEAQRMCLARTLLTRPGFVLFDEPTSSLDPAAAEGIEALAHGLADDGIPSAWVTHDPAQMRRLAHHLVVVVDGTVVQQGDASEVLSQPVPAAAAFLAGAR